jgi:hypothetical protein
LFPSVNSLLLQSFDPSSQNFWLLLFSVSQSPLSTILIGVLILILTCRLYPWHEILTENFEALEAITKKLEVTQAILHKKVDAVILLQADLNTRETKVLDLQNLIHHRIDNMVRKILLFLLESIRICYW